MIIEFARQLKEYYINSLFGKAIKSVGEGISRDWNNSLIGGWFLNDKADDMLQKSMAFKALTFLLLLWQGAVGKLSVLFQQAVKNSLFVSLARMQIANVLTLHSSFYGSMLVAFGLGGLLIDFGFGIGFYIRIAIIILGGLLVWLNRPFISYMRNSFFFVLIESVFGEKIELDVLERMQGKNSMILGAVNGLIMAMMGLFVPYLFTPAVFVAVTGLCSLLWRYEIGLFLLVFTAPILPTMACAGLAVFSFLSFIFRCILEKRAFIKMNAVSFLTFAFLAVLGFYAFTSFSIKKSVEIFILYAVFISIYFLIVNTITNKKRLFWVVSIFLTSSLFVSLYGIYQQFFGSNVGHAWLDEEMFEQITVRVYSTLENPNVLGEYLLFAIPLAMAMVLVSKGFLAKLYYAGIFTLSSLCLVFTQSRGCWIGIMLGLIVYIFLMNKRYMALFFVALLAAPFVLPLSVIERFMSIGDVSDSSTSYRVFIWFGTLSMLRDFWPFGLGLGSEAFNRVYPFYSYSNVYAPHTHNIYLQWITETGIVGLGVMLMLLFIFWRRLISGFVRFGRSMPSVIGIAVLAGSFAFMAQGAFDYVWYNYRVFLIFWMVLAIGIASHRMMKAGENCD